MSNGKKSYSRKSAQDRRQELVDAGIACLGQGGMAGFTVDRICKQAGISRGLMNHHFNGKDELLASIYEQMTDHLVQEYDAASETELLAEIIDTNFDADTFNRSNLRAWLAIWGQVSSHATLKRLHKDRYDQYRQRITRAIAEQSQAPGTQQDAESVARQLIAIIDGLWLEYCLHSESFSLAAARDDCYQFLEAYGISLPKRRIS